MVKTIKVKHISINPTWLKSIQVKISPTHRQLLNTPKSIAFHFTFIDCIVLAKCDCMFSTNDTHLKWIMSIAAVQKDPFIIPCEPRIGIFPSRFLYRKHLWKYTFAIVVSLVVCQQEKSSTTNYYLHTNSTWYINDFHKQKYIANVVYIPSEWISRNVIKFKRVAFNRIWRQFYLCFICVCRIHTSSWWRTPLSHKTGSI